MINLSPSDKNLWIQELEAASRRQLLFYKPYEQQFRFHAAERIAQEILFLGGNRTGKTMCGCLATVAHVTGMYPKWWPGHVFEKPIDAWVIGKSNKVVRESLQKQYYLGDRRKGTIGFIHPSLILDIDKAQGVPGLIDTVYVKHVLSGGVSKLGFKSNQQSQDEFSADKKDLIHVDEEMKMSNYMEARMRTTETEPGFRGLIIVTMTPLKGYTKLIQHFLDGRSAEHEQDKRWHIMASWSDNPFLTEEEKKRLLSGMSPHEIEARTKGIPYMGSGKVYPIPEAMITCIPFEIPKHWPRVYGLDFGWSKPTAVIFGAYDRDNGILYLYGEYYVSKLTPQKHADNLIERGISWMPGVYDPAGEISRQGDGEKVARLFRAAGFKNMVPANNSVEEGVLKVLEMIDRKSVV